MWCAQRPGAEPRLLFRTAAARKARAGRRPGSSLPVSRSHQLSHQTPKTAQKKLPFSHRQPSLPVAGSPAKWRLRLRGQPARTDVVLDMADTGIVRLEASVHRAPDLRNMPLSVDVDWREAQLGQLARLLIRLPIPAGAATCTRASPHTGHAQCGSGHRQVGRHGCTGRRKYGIAARF